MKTGNRTVDRNLGRAEARWRKLRFAELAGVTGSLVCLFFLLLALPMGAGWITDPSGAKALIVVAIVFALLALLGSAIFVIERDLDPRWLARVLESGSPDLLDRVNTLIALKQAKAPPETKPFYHRIAAQAQALLFRRSPPCPIPGDKARNRFLVFLGLLILTIFVYQTFSPWQRMEAARQARLAAANSRSPVPPQPPSLELAAPTNLVEQKLPWGEVRITDPARDLQVTKVDVVPIQVEAAANEPLLKIGWLSAINGKSEELHPLPPPADPRYAVYQPTLYLDEFKLSDWDVMTYFAKADTRASNSFASDVYFLEVRPFREDILKMPGGEGGKAMQCLNELSSLISQQQHVIRQTHQHVQSPPDTEKQRAQDRGKLADAEGDLSKASGHLYAQMASDLENKPIGDALDNLAKAEKTLAEAGSSLRKSALPEGQKQERTALAELVAARKAFQKAVSDNPDAFAEKPQEPPPPTAGQEDKLKEIAEFRDEAKAAQQFMDQLVNRQKNLPGVSLLTNAINRNAVAPNLAKMEGDIEKSLSDFREQHPRVFKPTGPEADAAQRSLQSATQSLQNKSAQSPQQVRQATEKLQQLAEAMKDKSAERQLADAYKLKQMLDREIEKIGQCQNPGAGGQSPSAAEVRQTVAETRQTLQQLKTAADQPPLRDEFGPQLGQALTDANMASLKWPLGELEQAATPEARAKPAGQAKEGLEKVSRAFEQSQPQSLQAAQKAARQGSQPDAQGEFEKGLSQLGSLIKQLQKKPPASSQDQAKLGQEALYHLQNAMKEKGGSNERGNQLLLQLDQELKKGEQPVDVEILQSVMDALQAFTVDLASKRDPKEPRPEMTELDSSRLPPAYRGRIQKYFEKLSER